MRKHRIATTARQPGDIHKAYLGGLYRLADEGLDELEIILDHAEPANAVRGYHSRLPFNGEAEASRLTGGGTYYHLQTKPDDNGNWTVPTRCVNIIKTADDSWGLEQHREYFGEQMLGKLTEATDFSRDDLVYDFAHDADIYTDKERNTQILGGSLRYFRFGDNTIQDTNRRGAFVYRACVQSDTESLDQSIHDSQWLLQRDNLDPERYRDAVQPVGPSFASSINVSHYEPERLVDGAPSIDAVIWGVQDGEDYGAKPDFLQNNPLRTSGERDPQPCLPATPPGWSYKAKDVRPPAWYQDITGSQEGQSGNPDSGLSNTLRIPRRSS